MKTLSFFVIIIVLTGCKKTKTGENKLQTCLPSKSVIYSVNGTSADSGFYKITNGKITEITNPDIICKYEYVSNRLTSKEIIYKDPGVSTSTDFFQYEYDATGNLIKEKWYLKTKSTNTLLPYFLKELEYYPDGLVKKIINKEDVFLMGNFKFVSAYEFTPDNRGNYSGMNLLNENGSIKNSYQLIYDNTINKFSAIDKYYFAIDLIDLSILNIQLFTTKNHLKEVTLSSNIVSQYEITFNESGYATQIRRNGLPFLIYSYKCE
jgi:hypothetical protein